MFRITIGLAVVALWLFLLLGMQSSGVVAEAVTLLPALMEASEVSTAEIFATLPGTTPSDSIAGAVQPGTTTAQLVAVEAKPKLVTLVEDSVATKPTTSTIEPSPVVVSVPVEPAVTETVALAVSSQSSTSGEVKMESFTELIESIATHTNQARQRDQKNALLLSSSLSAAATKRSLDMATRGYFAHETPDGCDLECHTATIAFDADNWGENIGWYEPYTYLSEAELGVYFVREWLKSSGHRRNILNEAFTHQGIGVALAGEKILVTVIFARQSPTVE